MIGLHWHTLDHMEMHFTSNRLRLLYLFNADETAEKLGRLTDVSHHVPIQAKGCRCWKFLLTG